MRKQEKQRKKQEQDRLRAGRGEANKTTSEITTTDTGTTHQQQQAEATGSSSEHSNETFNSSPAADSTVRTITDSMDKLTLVKVSESKIRDNAAEANVKPVAVIAKTSAEKLEQRDETFMSKAAAGASSEAKPKKDLSPEEQAAIKAAREAQKAAKAAAKAAAAQKKVSAAATTGTVPEVDLGSDQPKKNDVKATAAGAAAIVELDKEVKKVSGGKMGEAGSSQDVGDGKSKAELKAERRAKQEAQRAAKSQVEDLKQKSLAGIRVNLRVRYGLKS